MFKILLDFFKIKIKLKILGIVMRMIKAIFLPLLIIILVGIAFFTFRAKDSGTNQSGDTLILTTIRPLTMAVNEICRDVSKISVREITNGYMDSHSCFHDFSLTTKQVSDIEKSFLIVINGASLEPFMKNIKDRNIVNSSESIEIIEHKNEKNPWIWMSLSNYLEQIKNIYFGIFNTKKQDNNKLVQEDYEKISQNYDRYKKSIEDKQLEWKSKFEKFKGTKVLTISNEFDYLLKDFGLEPIHLIDEHVHGSLSPRNVSNAIKIIEDGKYKFYLSSNDKYCKIFDQTKAKSVKLDLIKSQDKLSYIEEMDKNLNLLFLNLKESYE